MFLSFCSDVVRRRKHTPREPLLCVSISALVLRERGREESECVRVRESCPGALGTIKTVKVCVSSLVLVKVFTVS